MGEIEREREKRDGREGADEERKRGREGEGDSHTDSSSAA